MYSYPSRPLPPLKNTFIKVKIPTAVNVFFFTLLYGFGLDFGFKKLLKKKIRIITKWLQFFITLLIIVIHVLEVICKQTYINYAYFYLISYLLHYLFLYRTKYTVCDLIINIHMLIDNKSIVVTNRVGTIISILTIIAFVSKYSTCNLNRILYVDHCQNIVFSGYVTCITIAIINGIAIVLILINYYIYISLKYIKKSMNKVDTKVFLDNFIYVADCWDKIKPLYTKMVSLFISL